MGSLPVPVRCQTLVQDSTSSGRWRDSVSSGDEVPRHTRRMREGPKNLWAWMLSEVRLNCNGCTQIERYPMCMKVLVVVFVCTGKHMGVCVLLYHG